MSQQEMKLTFFKHLEEEGKALIVKAVKSVVIDGILKEVPVFVDDKLKAAYPLEWQAFLKAEGLAEAALRKVSPEAADILDKAVAALVPGTGEPPKAPEDNQGETADAAAPDKE